jgi:ribosomal peptide maturation radical SAM protein 1
MENLIGISPVSKVAAETSNKGSVALVYMPWGSFTRGSIALGILKECARQTGCEVDCHYLNIALAQATGLEQYDHIARNSVLSAEWFFSANLFRAAEESGAAGSSWQNLQVSPQGRTLATELRELLGGSEEACRNLAEKIIPEFIDQALNSVAWHRYDVIGFSVTFAQTLSSLLLARRIKEKYPEKIIVFGGANVDGGMGLQLIRAFPWIDYVVHGEAEKSFPALLRNIFTGNRFGLVNGVSFRDGERLVANDHTAQPLARMDESPVPDYSDYMAAISKTGIKSRFQIKLPFESSRGCWWGAKHHCAFCGLNRDSMAFRKKSPERAYAEIIYLSGQYKCCHIYAVDNILDMLYFKELLPRLADLDIDLNIFYEVKANLTREQVRALRRAGIRTIQPGIESFNTELLRQMNKGVTAIQNLQLLKWCREEQIDVVWNILYGFPGEERRHYQDLPDLVTSISHLQPPLSVSPIVIERFSPYHSESERYKLRIKPAEVYSLLYPGQRIDFDALAYYFDTLPQPGEQGENVYIGEVLEACKKWKNSWKDERFSFFYEKGPNFLALYDSRPHKFGSGRQARRIVLHGEKADIYAYCDQHRSFKAILEYCKSRGHALAEEDLRGFLDVLIQNRLVYRENDHYMALATRKPAVTAAYAA